MRAGHERARYSLHWPPRRRTWRTTLVVFAPILASVTSACSEQPKHRAPTEEQIHAEAVSMRARHVGTHRFQCDDGTLLLVDFRNDGMTLEIRNAPKSAPLMLTASRQGAPYIGRGAKAMMKERDLELIQAGGARRVCIRQSLG